MRVILISTLALMAALLAASIAQATPTCFGREATIVDRNPDGARVVGTSGSDRIVTGRGDDRIFGRGGHDYICSGAGDDVIRAGAGRDNVSGERGHDSIESGSSGDGSASPTLMQGDRLLGGSGRDKLTGGDGADLLHGGNGRDRLFAGRGHDYLVGARGKDVLRGGRGRSDRVTYGDLPWGDDYDAGSVVLDLVKGTAVAEDGNDRLWGIEIAIGSDGQDVLRGDGRPNLLAGLSGSDVLRGRGGDDTLVDDDSRPYRTDEPVTPGDDAIYGGPGSDAIRLPGEGRTVDLQEGTLTGSGSDSFFSIENVFGSIYRDIIRGDEGVNLLIGSVGDDTIEGRGGDDTLLGDEGDDMLDGGDGTDLLDGGRGNDICRNGEQMRGCEA